VPIPSELRQCGAFPSRGIREQAGNGREVTLWLGVNSTTWCLPTACTIHKEARAANTPLVVIPTAAHPALRHVRARQVVVATTGYPPAASKTVVLVGAKRKCTEAMGGEEQPGPPALHQAADGLSDQLPGRRRRSWATSFSAQLPIALIAQPSAVRWMARLAVLSNQTRSRRIYQ